MAVNTSVYGLSAQWSNAFFQQAQITDKNKLAYFGENAKTLSQGVINNKLSYSQPIDKSLSYCGLGTESAMSHVVYCGLHDNAFKAYDSTDRQVTNFSFFEKQTNTVPITQDLIFLNELNRVAWTENMNSEWNITGDLIPYTVINPHNIVLYVSVDVSNGDGTYTTTSFNYFKNAHTTQNWTRIARVNITPYFGNLSDNVQFSASAGYSPTPQGHSVFLGLLDEYVVNAKNKRFYMYENPAFAWTVFGFVGANGIGSLTDTNIMYMCYMPESAKSHIKYDSSHREFYIEYYDDMIEDIIKTVACFGLYFSGGTTAILNGDFTNENMYIGLIDDDGVGRGRYLQGADTVNAPQAQAGFKDMHTIPYDYKSVDNTKYQNDTEFYTSALADGFTRFWVMNSTGVDALLSELYDIMNDDDPDISIERYNMKVFLTQNPIDAVISLKKFPIDNVPSISGAYFINIGAKSTSISANPLAASCGIYTFSFSSASDTSLYPHYNNSFLDYEPYTKVELYIPFCGTYEIPCTYLYDYGGVEVKLIIDFISGACTGYVLCNSICIGSCSGSCAITLPLSGLQSATLDSQIHSAAVRDTQRSNSLAAGIAAGAVSIAAGIFTGGTAALIGVAAAAVGIGTAAVKSATEQAQIEYEVSHMQTPLKQVSSASGQIAHTYDMRAKLTISRPKISGDYDAEVYANTVGFACIINDKIKNLSGLTQGTVQFKDMVQYDNENNVIATCTDTEKELIRNAFAGGVIL